MCWNTKSSTHLPREGVPGSPIKTMHVTLETTPIIYCSKETPSNESNLLIGLITSIQRGRLLIWIKAAITYAERNMANADLTSSPSSWYRKVEASKVTDMISRLKGLKTPLQS